MPTSHVLPESAELLQDIADALFKAKKVLVVTGAGISTNSGIPDFRSKNGLYSLIQAQFDSAHVDDDKDDDEADDDKPKGPEPRAKRQKVAQDGALPSRQESTVSEPERIPVRRSARLGSSAEQDTNSTTNSSSSTSRNSSNNSRSTSPAQPTRITPAPSTRITRSSRRNTPSGSKCAPTDPMDDDNSIVVLPALNPKKIAASAMCTPQRRTRASMLALSESMARLPPNPMSSPLSSPPSVLFDPSEDFRSANPDGSASSSSSVPASACSSESESDTDSTPTQPTLSTQSSFASSKDTLTTMKGRDLFDASIWADPVKTSVFYTFATTLRQKVREVVPTRSHEFISHLRDTNKLVRCYTQNIDEIEEKVGLSTSLILGPGKRGRFSTRSLSRKSTGVTADKDDSAHETADDANEPESQELASTQELQSAKDADKAQPDKRTPASQDPSDRGVECVFLHGSLRLLRCFRCGQTTPWDEDGREHETMSGRQPSCPRCAGATAAREGRGKRALAVGKLRPDIVLYGEEHPNAHLISPIVQHDLSLAPDMLLILGTSLKVHGLKVLVREFSKAVHNRGGNVVFVNYTKPPESVWSDIIDYWVQWDCDAWVQDLKEKKPIMWMPPGTVIEEAKKKRKSIPAAGKGARKSDPGKVEGGEELTVQLEVSVDGATLAADQSTVVKKERKKREPKAKTPKTTADGALPPSGDATSTETECGDKTDKKLAKQRSRKAAASQDSSQDSSTMPDSLVVDLTIDPAATTAVATPATEEAAHPPKPTRAPRKRKPRHSAPAEMEVKTETEMKIVIADRSQSPMQQPAHEMPALLPSLRAPRPKESPAEPPQTMPLAEISGNTVSSKPDDYSILSAVKANPRRRRSKKVFEQGDDSCVVQSAKQPRKPSPAASARTPRERPKSTSNPMDITALLSSEPSSPAKGATQAPDLTRASDASHAAQQVAHADAWSGTEGIAEQLMTELLAFHQSSSSQPLSQSQSQPLSQPLSAAAATSSPHATVLPSFRQHFADHFRARWTNGAFALQDPLCDHYGFPPTWPQEWSCTNQLEREARERAVSQQLQHAVGLRR